MPSFYFTLLIVVFIIACIWGLFNLIQTIQLKSQSKDSGTTLLGSLFGQQPDNTPTYSPPNVIYQPPPISKDDADDLALGELPPRRRDYRKIYDPLKEPSRRYISYPNGYIPGGNINIPTQGYLPSYQNMGYLSSGEDGPNKMLKLYGRRLDTHRYEYYTTHHKDPTLKIPLEIKNDKELMDGDNVHVPGYQSDYKVTLYDFEAPKYIPYL